jgi:MFS family permease
MLLIIQITLIIFGVLGTIFSQLFIASPRWRVLAIVLSALSASSGALILALSPFLKPETSVFKVELYESHFGASMEATSRSTGQRVTLNNPFLLLLKISNVGSKPSSITNINLEAKVRGVRYFGTKEAMNGPFRSGNKSISGKNDLFLKLHEAIAPGYSLAGALQFYFPDQPPGLLMDLATREMSLTFSDIYENQYVFPVKFSGEASRPDATIGYPGIVPD